MYPGFQHYPSKLPPKTTPSRCTQSYPSEIIPQKTPSKTPLVSVCATAARWDMCEGAPPSALISHIIEDAYGDAPPPPFLCSIFSVFILMSVVSASNLEFNGESCMFFFGSLGVSFCTGVLKGECGPSDALKQVCSVFAFFCILG